MIIWCSECKWCYNWNITNNKCQNYFKHFLLITIIKIVDHWNKLIIIVPVLNMKGLKTSEDFHFKLKLNKTRRGEKQENSLSFHHGVIFYPLPCLMILTTHDEPFQVIRVFYRWIPIPRWAFTCTTWLIKLHWMIPFGSSLVLW